MTVPPTQEPRKIRILLVDDHVVVRMGLAIAANGEADMEVVAEAENGEAALRAFRTERPDVVVLDLRMPKQGGFETIRVLRKEFGPVRILVFSSYANADEAAQAFREGASGFVMKEMPIAQVLDAIRKVHDGAQFIPPEISTRIGGLLVSQLSPRELEVLTLLARGNSNKEVGAHLGLAEPTVKAHVTNVLAKLGAADRTQAVLAAMKRGIIQLE
ncbi:MAG TPA: response regulator transcription factor [Opitutaceae bacterium]|nr:response regulator transcription factor [Opitutaceae bacterium]